MVSDDSEPKFLGPIANVTVAIKRDAQLACVVQGLGQYKVAWLRLEDKGILTIHHHVISRNYRIGLISDNRTFVLIIRNVQPSDAGGYMCQVNTIPMRSITGYLDVVVPPYLVNDDIDSDRIIMEKESVTLECRVKGHPQPVIQWRREDHKRILNKRVFGNVTANHLILTNVTREQMGAYLCIASNGVPPAISKRILLHVQFAPKIWASQSLIIASIGANISLHCNIESYPSARVYWYKSSRYISPNLSTSSFLSSSLLISSSKYKIKTNTVFYKTENILTIININSDDHGTYKCYAVNTFGEDSVYIHINVTSSISYVNTKKTLIGSSIRQERHQTSIVNNHNSNASFYHKYYYLSFIISLLVILIDSSTL